LLPLRFRKSESLFKLFTNTTVEGVCGTNSLANTRLGTIIWELNEFEVGFAFLHRWGYRNAGLALPELRLGECEQGADIVQR